MTYYLELQEATSIARDDKGIAYAWVGGDKIKVFFTDRTFRKYVRENIKGLKDAVAFTSSAYLLEDANGYIAKKLKGAGLL